MKKYLIFCALGVAFIAIVAVGFLFWRSKQSKETEKLQIETQNSENQSAEQNIEFEMPKGWKLYKNENFGIEMAYPENNYNIEEESGMIHFYYKDGTATPGSQKENYINININKEKNPQGVGNLDELFQYSENEPDVKVDRITNETEIKIVGNTRFLIVKSYNNGTFYKVLFVAMSRGESYNLSFGGYWNVIKTNQYEIIMKIMESFKFIT